LRITIAGNAICPVTLLEEFSRLWVETLTHCLEILGGNLSFETKQFSTASVPLAFDSPILVVIVARLEMALCVALTAVMHESSAHADPNAVRSSGSRELPLVVYAFHIRTSATSCQRVA